MMSYHRFVDLEKGLDSDVKSVKRGLRRCKLRRTSGRIIIILLLIFSTPLMVPILTQGLTSAQDEELPASSAFRQSFNDRPALASYEISSFRSAVSTHRTTTTPQPTSTTSLMIVSPGSTTMMERSSSHTTREEVTEKIAESKSSFFVDADEDSETDLSSSLEISSSIVEQESFSRALTVRDLLIACMFVFLVFHILIIFLKGARYISRRKHPQSSIVCETGHVTST